MTTKAKTPRKRATVKDLLAELTDPLRAAYNALDGLALSSDEVKAYKDKILTTARERTKKGGLFFTKVFTYEQARTLQGKKEIAYYLNHNINEGELALLKDIKAATNDRLNLIPESREKELKRSKDYLGEKGLLHYLSDKDGISDSTFFIPYLTLLETYGDYKSLIASLLITMSKEGTPQEERKGIYEGVQEIFAVGGIVSKINLWTYELLRRRDWRIITKEFSEPQIFADETESKAFGENVTPAILGTVVGTKAKATSISKLSQILHIPLKKLQDIATPSLGKIVMSKALAQKQYKWQIEHDETEAGKDLREKLDLLQRNLPGFTEKAKQLPKGAEYKTKLFDLMMDETTRGDLFAHDSFFQTCFRALMERAAKMAADDSKFNGVMLFSSYNELAELCGFSVYDNHKNNERLNSFLTVLRHLEMRVFEKDKENFSFSIIKAISSITFKGRAKGRNITESGFEVKLNQDFLKAYFEGISNKGKYFLTAPISKVTEFYRLGMDKPIKAKILGREDKRKTKKLEIPTYTLSLITVVESKMSMEGGNNSISKALLFERMDLQKYIDRRRPKEAEWRLREAFAALQYAGFYKTIKKRTGSNGEVIEFIF